MSTLLRRIVETIRARDWFTFTIEFVIVVAGVFIGIQVANWNEERKFAAQERSYLWQLRDEIANNNRAVGYQAQYTGEVVAAGQRALAYLDSGSDCADLLVTSFTLHKSGVQAICSPSTASWNALVFLATPRSEAWCRRTTSISRDGMR